MPTKAKTVAAPSALDDLSPRDHAILRSLSIRIARQGKKDRAYYRRLGIAWGRFLKDKKKGDPRITAGAKQYGLDSDNLRRCLRLHQNWDQIHSIADPWAAVRPIYRNGYLYEPQKSLTLLDDCLADLKLDNSSADEATRLAPTANSDSQIDVVHGECLQAMQSLTSRYYQTCITSPPYWRMRNWASGAIGMEPTMADYLTALVAVFREVRRVLRDDGVCWLVIGDRYATRARGDESDRGRFVYYPVPAAPSDEIPVGNRMLIPQRLALGLQADGWIVRSCIAWDKIRQVSTGTKSRPLAMHDEILMLTKRLRYRYAEPLDATITERRSGPYQRILGMRDRLPSNGHTYSADVLRIVPELHHGHTAPFPVALARWCAIRTCAHGDRIIDPFGGSGTVGVVAKELGVSATLIEINENYVELSRRRIKAAPGPVIADGQVVHLAQAAD